MIHIGYSGGGLKGIGQFGIAESISDKIKPDILSGISVGTIIALLHALVISKLITWKEVKEIFFRLNSKSVFKTHPYSFKGICRGLLSFILPSIHSFGNQSNLKKLLTDSISKEIYETYRVSNNTPDVYVGYVDYKSGELVVKNLKLFVYEDAINIILASCHVPVATESIKLFGTYGYDGGLFDHCVSAEIIERYKFTITKNINIFSRPSKNYNVKEDWKPKNVGNVSSRTLELGIARISKDDEKLINAYSKIYDIKNYSIYLPTVLNNMYDFNHDNLYKLYLAGKKQGNDFINELWQY
jgi:predicted acylesterase/phospholipase RssA